MRDDVTVLLLGPVRLATPAGPVAVRDGDQRTVLARLAASPGELVRVHELIEALWGESFPITAVKTLHSHVARLRRELRATGLDGLISTDGSGYCLQVPPACVDSIRFESLARMGRRHLNAGEFSQVVRTLNDATRLWRGKPLADCRRTPWALREAERLSDIMASIRDTLGSHIETPAIDTEKPSFVSRDADVEDVTWLLANGRMATLTGVGGVGKSTLAAQVAHCNQSSYPDGVWFVELAALHDFGLLAHTVADALGLHDQSGRPMTTVLANHFKSQIALLILDNCEQVGAACASFVDTLLHAAPDLRILVTSKVPLHIEAEQIYDVKPLPVPDPDQDESGAVTLFVQRAAESLPDGFELTEENHAEVVSLCCRLEGVPLALELAAAQMRQLPLSELVAQLDGMIRLKPAVRAIVDFSYELCSPAERLLWRRMSVFEGSYDLLAVENVCAGYNDIPLDTVLDVLDGLVGKSVLIKLDEPGPVRYRLPETLRQYGREQLRLASEQALVRRRHRNWYLTVAELREEHWFGPAQQDLSIRTRLDHANLRAALEFCLSEPGEEAAGLRLAAALWFHWIGSGLLAEAQHWLDWALSATRQSTIDRWKALWVNGYVTALQGKTEAARQLLAQIDADADETTRTHATYVLGLTALLDNDRAAAATLLQRAAEQYRDIGELDATAIMARVAWALTAAPPKAEQLCEEAQDTCEINGEKWSLAYVLLARGVIAARRGELAAAAALARESLRLKESCHDLLGVAAAIGLLAVTTADSARTAALLGIARRIRLHIGPDGPPAVDAAQVRCAEQAKKALGDAEFDAAFVQGARMSLSAAVDFALS